MCLYKFYLISMPSRCDFFCSIRFNFSKFLYDLTRHDGHNPSQSVLCKWIEALASKLGVSLKSSEHIRTVLIRRANYLKGKVKACTGSAKRMRYLQQEWELKLCEQDIDFTEMKSRVETLEDEVTELQQEISHAAQDIQQLVQERNEHQEKEELAVTVSRLQKDNQRLKARYRELSAVTNYDTPKTRGRSYKPDEAYSESHRRRLKRQRTESCNKSLSWLEDQGFIPVTVTMQNLSTGMEETIHLCDDDLVELFGQSNDMDDETLDMVSMMLYIKDWYNISDGA